jgi:hypothetical protein
MIDCDCMNKVQAIEANWLNGSMKSWHNLFFFMYIHFASWFFDGPVVEVFI